MAEITKQHYRAAETERAKPHTSPSYSLEEGLLKADNGSQADGSHKADQ
jgi:hypothetical protein